MMKSVEVRFQRNMRLPKPIVDDDELPVAGDVDTTVHRRPKYADDDEYEPLLPKFTSSRVAPEAA